MEREIANGKHSPPGHRARQKHKLIKYGGYILDDEELLEMLLYYVMPRIDTKPTAHELIERFGSIKGILDANGSDVKSVKGLKENAEVLFLLLRQVSVRDFGGTAEGDFRDVSVVCDHLFKVFAGVGVETVYALYLDNYGSALDGEMIFRGEIGSVRFPLRAVTEGVIRNRANSVILAHNHPSGEAIPSDEDITATDRIAAHLAANDITLAEHYIVGKSSCAGIMSGIIYEKK